MALGVWVAHPLIGRPFNHAWHQSDTKIVFPAPDAPLNRVMVPWPMTPGIGSGQSGTGGAECQDFDGLEQHGKLERWLTYPTQEGGPTRRLRQRAGPVGREQGQYRRGGQETQLESARITVDNQARGAYSIRRANTRAAATQPRSRSRCHNPHKPVGATT